MSVPSTSPTPPGRTSGQRINPFDFRTPVSNEELLIGREEEKEEIDRYMAATAEGNAVNIAVTGPRGSGKTSLLNEVERRAERHALMPVRLDLDSATASGAVPFYSAILGEAVETLADLGGLSREESEYVTWCQQLAGVDIDDPTESLLLFGMIASRGEDSLTVSPPMIRRDFEKILGLVGDIGLNGVVLILDEADLLTDNESLIQQLRNILQSVGGLSVVVAGRRSMFSDITNVFSPIPRQFAHMPVEPLKHLFEVYLCVVLPQTRVTDEPHIPTPDVVADIARVTGGRPYEVNLVSYFIWEAIEQGSQTDFTLSQTVLDSVLSELERVGQTLSLHEIEGLRGLRREDLIMALDLLPFEGLLVGDIARAHQLPNAFDETRFEQDLSTIDRQLSELSEIGVVRYDGERFSILGGDTARVYFKYQCKRLAPSELTDDVVWRTSRFSMFMHYHFQRWFERDIRGETNGETYDRTRVHELSDDRVGRYLSDMARAVDDGDIVNMPDITPRGHPRGSWLASWKESIQHGINWVGALFQVETDVIETAWIWPARSDEESGELSDRVQGWASEVEKIFQDYGFSWLRIETRQVTSELAWNAQLYRQTTQPASVDGFSYMSHVVSDIYSDGDLDDALELAVGAVDVVESAWSEKEIPRRIATNLSDLLNRAGFLNIATGRFSEARPVLRKALDLGSSEQWLVNENMAVAEGLLGQHGAACDRLRQSLEYAESEELPGSVYLHMVIPRGDIPEGRVELVTERVQKGHILPFLEADLLALRLLDKQIDPEDFQGLTEELVAQFGEETFPHAQRVIAGTLLAIGQDAGYEILRQLAGSVSPSEYESSLITDV